MTDRSDADPPSSAPASSENKAFLLALSDRLRSIADPVEIQALAARMLGEHLRVNRVTYVDIEGDEFVARPGYVSGVEPIPPVKMSAVAYGGSFLEACRRGETIVVHDLTTDDRLSTAERESFAGLEVRAFVAVMMLRNGKWVGSFGIQSSRPRRWMHAVLELVREVADRTWAAAERARAEAALRESELRYRTFFDSMVRGVAVMELIRGPSGDATDIRYLEANARFEPLVGRPREEVIGKLRSETSGGDEEFLRVAERVVDSGESTRVERYVARLDRWYDVAVFPYGAPRFATIYDDITARKKVEQALRESEERLRLVLEATRLAVFDWDLTTDKMEANTRFRELFGLEDGKPILGRVALCEPVHADDRAFVNAELERALGGGKAAHFEFEFRALGRDGVRWILTYGQVSFAGEDAARRPIRVTGNGLDITERKLTEEALKRNEARQAYLLALSDTIRPLVDPTAILTATTKHLAEHLKTSRAYYVEYHPDEGAIEVSAESIRNGAPGLLGTYRISDFSPLLEVLRAGRPVVVNDFSSADFLPAEVRARFISLGTRAQITVPLIKAGKLVMALTASETVPREWTALDVSLVQETAERTWAAVGRSHIEVALKTSEERYRTLVENIRDYAIFLLDPSGAVTEWPAGAERVKGYPAEEVIGRSVAMFYPPEDITEGRVERELSEAAASGHSEREVWRVRKGGARFWANEITTAIRGEDGKLTGFTVVCRDLSEQKELQERSADLLDAATAAHAEAKRANRTKDEFLATLSHELRTPLTAILLWTEVLRSSEEPLEDLDRAVSAIRQSAKAQSRLIEDLLDLSRLTSGKILLAPKPVSVEAVAREAIDVLQVAAEAKAVTLELDLEVDLGRAVLDASRLQQVLANLLANAIKFTPESGKVVLRIRRIEQWLEVEVIDTGEGIAADFMPVIFERFRQADMGETRRHAGLGIGLALSRQLVELQGGTVEAESEGLGCGSTFRVRLPWVEPGDDSPPENARVSSPEDFGSALLAGVTVLLVEDDESTREAMRWTLERAGAKVVPVGSGPEALAFLDPFCGDSIGEKSRPCALVLVSDLGLPGISGYELVERIVHLFRARDLLPPPACAVSAHARDIDRRRAIEAGFDLYLPKPVSPLRLIEAVSDLRDMTKTAADGD